MAYPHLTKEKNQWLARNNHLIASRKVLPEESLAYPATIRREIAVKIKDSRE
jgi:hypothetical protein